MLTEEAYYKEYGLSHPAYNVVRVAGRNIQSRAANYFSGTMLEIGCGAKQKSALVGKYIEVHLGMDLADTIHDQSNIDLFGTAYYLPINSNSCDCILSTSVLEHLEEPQAALMEAIRVLKPGGYGLYTMPFYWHLHEEPRDYFRYTKYGLRHLFACAGFEILEITPLSGFWITFGTEFSYYIQRFKKGLLRHLVSCITGFNNLLFPIFDHGYLRDEKFSWLYIVLVRKPSD